MYIKKLKEEIKRILFAASQPELKVSEMVIGGKVEVINSDGSLSPAEDGEYTIDKDVLVVKDGQIVSINGETETAPVEEEQAAEADAPVVEDVPADADWKAEVDALKAETETLKAAIEELKKAMEDDKASEQTMSAEFSKQLTELTNVFKVAINTPFEFSKTNQSAIEKEAKENKMLIASNLWANRK